MRRRAKHHVNVLLAAYAVLIGIYSPAAAETVEEFYRGKTITMYVGTGPGGGAVSGYPMALAQVIKKYIPGNPNLVVSHMPGAGGIKAATFIESVAPQDGTAWGFITRGFMLAPLLKLPQANFQPAKFNWIGSPARTVSMGAVWNAWTPVRTIQDAMQKEVVVGATSIAQDTGIYPRALNRVAGTKFKIVTGYAGARRRRHRDAARRGAGQGRLDLGLAQLRPQRALGYGQDRHRHRSAWREEGPRHSRRRAARPRSRQDTGRPAGAR